MGVLVITCLLLGFFSTVFSRVSTETTCWSDVDIVFLLDGSDSISDENFLKEKAFVNSLAAFLQLGANKSRASVITYGDEAKLDISFGEYSSLQKFQDAVDDLTHSKGMTRLDRALRLATLGAFALGSSRPRPGVSKVMVILTYSKQTQTVDSIPIQDAVKPLRDAGVRILVVAIGNSLDPAALDLLIERAEDIFIAPNFDDLRDKAIAIGQRKCKTVKPEPEPLCQHPADIVFVMDASSGISEADFQMQKRFIKAVGSSFFVNSTETRLGLISYSASAHLHVHFEGHDVNRFNSIVDAVFQDSKSSRIDQALMVSLELFGADSDDGRLTPKVLVILTDGNQAPDPDAVPLPDAIEPLKQLGVRVFAIAVGNAVNANEFREIVQRRNHVVAVDGFPDLLLRSRQISREICDLVIVPPESVCNENADIVFVIDASEDITEQDFQKQKNLVKTIASSFNFGPRETKCGLVAFGNDAKIYIRFMDVLELRTFQEEVERVPFSAGSTQLDAALRLAATQLFTPQAGARSSMPKILVVVRGGSQTSSSRDLSLGEAVTPLVDLGVRIYVVAVGNVTKEGQLQQLVQNDQELLAVSDYQDLEEQARYIARRTCELIIHPPEFICTNYADISFVMDSSLSTRESNFQRQKDFVNIMASSLNVGPEKSHLGVIVFSNEATLSIKFNEQADLFAFQNAVQSIPYNAGSSHIDKALFVASQQLFAPSGGMRPEVNKVLVLITDGKQTLAPDAPPPQIALDALRQKAVRIYLIGVGDDLDHQWLRQLVQRDQDLMIAYDFKELFNRTRQVAQKICDLTVTPAEDGMFTEWQEWTTCSRACGYGTRARLRSCSNPPPAYGGQDCFGTPYQTAYCQIKPCPVDGSWSPWRRWGYCSNTCGRGVQRRRRFCTSPPPSNEGKDCLGSQEETRYCETRPCPVGGGWSEWKNWTSCSLTCGTGTLSRIRECTNPPPAFGGQYCGGLGKEVRPCNQIPCPVHGNWSAWGDWAICSTSCGGGSTSRQRSCTNPKPIFGGLPCEGASLEIKRCSIQHCPIHGNWSEWGDWVECSESCGGGSTTRQRTCTRPAPKHGGRPCKGESLETKACNIQLCPIHGNWSGWGDWLECSRSCGGGSTRRVRACTNPRPQHGGRQCVGDNLEIKGCNMQFCPIHGNWSEWAEWYQCSKSCGGGSTKRQRTCTRPTPKHGGRPCKGENLESKICNDQLCPVHGNWSGWGDWFECSSSCGGGSTRRERACTNPRPQRGGRQCEGNNFEAKACNTQFCPIHGNWSEWGDWYECSTSCGGGLTKRQRSCTSPKPEYGGQPCEGEFFETKKCNNQFCPIHGNWSEWGDWVECSESCGGGSTTRQRTCTRPTPKHGGRPCKGETFQTKTCNNLPCPIHGNWSEWKNWTSCSHSCGSGYQTRSRDCTSPPPQFGGRFCEGPGDEARRCNQIPCPVNGNWSSWGDWVICSTSCGEGSRRRERSCTNPRPMFGGLPCEGASFEAKLCNMQPCPIHGNWSEWADWLDCSKSCGGGYMKRARTCTSPEPEHGGQPCQGKSFQTKTCNDVVCPVHGNWTDWSKWSVCSETCGGGIRHKYRICSNPAPANGGNECSGIGFDLRLCNEQPCPVHGGWSGWSPWSACSKSCDRGTRSRFRSCNSPSPVYGGRCCKGSRAETRNCSVQSCPVIRCKERAYIGILMDGSRSISKPDFQNQKDFVNDLASRFMGGKLQAQLGLISFSEDAHLHARFTDHDSLRSFQGAVENVPQEKKATRIDKALTLASKHLFTSRGGVLSQVPRVLIVLTSGKQTAAANAIPLEDAVQPSRRLGVRVFAVAVGNQADPEQLRLLVQRDEDVLQVAGFTDLLENTDQIVNRICKMIILPPVPLCTEKVDIGFLMDASGSIGELDFQKERDFVKAVASAFNVSTSQTQLGLIDYSKEANIRIKFGDYRNLASFQAAVDAIPYQGNTTRIDKALQLAASDLFNPAAGARVGHTKIMIMLSDGVQTNDPDAKPLKEAVRPLRDRGVKVVAVGVGSHTDPLELEMLVERESDLFAVTDYADLLNKAHEISKRTCDIAKVRCSKKVNLGFLVDSSSSVGYANFKTQKEFVKRIAASFRVGPKDKSPGVITYSGAATLHVRLGDHRTISAFQTAVNRIPYLGGATRIDKGLIVAANRLFTPTGGVQPDTPKVLILLTDGQQSPDAFRDPVRILNHMGVKIIAVGIGSQVDHNGLRFTVEEERDIFAVDSFGDLLDTVQQVVASSCHEQAEGNVVRPASPTSFASFDARCPVQADVGFILAATSENVGIENFIKQKEFLNDLVLSTFYVGMQETRIGVITANKNATIDIRFDKHNTIKAFNQAVANITLRKGATQLDRAVRLASSRLFTVDFGSRSNVPRVLVILSDGREEVDLGAADLKSAVEPLHNADIRVLVVGIGIKANPEKLGQLVEREENVFFVYDFNHLLLKTRDISSSTCGLLQEYETGRINGDNSVCPNRIDLGFVIDSSNSAGPKGFENEKELVKSVAIHFDISKPGTRAGVIVYSDNAIVNVRLNQYKSYTAFERAINMLPYFGEGNRKDRALRAANSMFQSRKPRDAVPSRSRSKVMFLMAEGKETVSPGEKSLRASAQPLHQTGVKVVVLGIGRQARFKELSDIAGDSKNVFMVSSLREIHKIAETLRRKACELPGEAKRRT